MTGVLDLSGNGEWGLYEHSFLGNNYSGAIHTAQNGIYKHPILNKWFHGDRDFSGHERSPNKSVAKGELILPPVNDRNGFQYRATNAGTLGSGPWGTPAYPTVIGDTVLDHDVTVQCFMEEGGPVASSPHGAHINNFSWIYMELDQNPANIQGDYVQASNVDFDMALTASPYRYQVKGRDMPFTVTTRGQLGATPEFYLRTDVGGAGVQTDPLLAARFFCDNTSPYDGYSPGWIRDTNPLELRWGPNLRRWIWCLGPSATFLSYSWCAGRSLPYPGVLCFPSIWIGPEGKERKITAFRATDGYLPDFTDLNNNIDGAAFGAYQTGDIIINSGGDRSSSKPIWSAMWRGRKFGGGVPQLESTWSAGMTVWAGQVIRGQTAGDSVFQAQNEGITGSPPGPGFTDTPGSTYSDNGITWLQIGPNGGGFEPLVTESPTLGIIDCISGGTINVQGDSAAYARFKLINSPGFDFSVIIDSGAAGSWDRVIWNTTNRNATIQGSRGDTGVTIPANTAWHVISDGTNTAHVV